MVAISLASPSATEGVGLAVGDDDGAAGLGHRAAKQEALALAGRQQIDLELDGEHGGVFRHQRKGGIAAGGIQRRRDDAGMQEAMLLGQRGRIRHLDLDVPGVTSVSSAPMVAMALCRAKEARTRSSKSVSVSGATLSALVVWLLSQQAPTQGN